MAMKCIVLLLLLTNVVIEASNPGIPGCCLGCGWYNPKKGLAKKIQQAEFVAKKHFGKTARSKRSIADPISIE